MMKPLEQSLAVLSIIREKREYIPFDSPFLFVYSLMRL